MNRHGFLHALWRIFPYTLLLLVAMPLRLLDLGLFLTVDEANAWIPRSLRFLDALQAGSFAGMKFPGHPGVTTMWLGSAGIWLYRLLVEAGFFPGEPFPVMLLFYRLPAALAHGAALLVGYALLRRLLSPAVALLAALLWATDPFLS